MCHGDYGHAVGLDLYANLVDLTRAVCDVPSVSGSETALADAVETALRQLAHVQVERDGDAVVARTQLGRSQRVIIAGHLDTVPLAHNLPTRMVTEGTQAAIWGRGTVDMKAGVAVQLALAAAVVDPRWDITWVFYDHEEVAADLNGLGRLARLHPQWLVGDFAVLCEPTAAKIEGGCNGTLRVEITATGVTAHSARSWMGVNAIHGAGEILRRLSDYQPATVTVDGLEFREGLNAVAITGGIAGNVIPDLCTVTVNYRFAPARTVAEATTHLQEVFAGFELKVVDAAAGARPGLDHQAAVQFIAAVVNDSGEKPQAKLGWTDVARFGELGIPAINYGPGDPLLAHADDEQCPVWQIEAVYNGLFTWLTGADTSPDDSNTVG